MLTGNFLTHRMNQYPANSKIASAVVLRVFFWGYEIGIDEENNRIQK
jgi:hypothetical protein